MDRKTLIRSMESYAGGGFMTRQRFAAYMGIRDPRRAKEKYLNKLDAVDGKYYFIPDIVSELIRRCE